MRFDRNTYFNYVREVLFEGALTQQQVDGQNLIIAIFENQYGGTPMTDVRWLAYMLATTFHETGYKMWPNSEQGSQEYLTSKSYWPFIGRGLVHLTWEDNYRSAGAALGLIDDRDLVAHPEMALDSLIAVRVMFRGMAEGWFTGAKLGQFFNDETDDPYNARTIINGHDKANEIAGYHDQFLTALEESRLEGENA
jgi:putative chitinase